MGLREDGTVRLSLLNHPVYILWPGWIGKDIGLSLLEFERGPTWSMW